MTKHLVNTAYETDPRSTTWCGRQFYKEDEAITHVWDEVTCGNCIRAMRASDSQFNEQYLARITPTTVNVIANAARVLGTIANEERVLSDTYRHDAVDRWTYQILKAVNEIRMEQDLLAFLPPLD